MPSLDLGDATIYFETHGDGEPLLFLNGIMMSTASWAAFVPQLAGKFKLVLIDFRDQGRSSRMSDPYTQDIHVGDITRLLDELQLPAAHVMGVSYGGQVALRFALVQPRRIRSLSLFNVPNRVTRRLIEIGKAWETGAVIDNGSEFFRFALPFIYSEPFFETHFAFLEERKNFFRSVMTREWFDGFIRLSRSVEHYFVSPEELKSIRIPTLLVGADQDAVVSQDAMKDIHENIPGCEFLLIPGSGHAAFLEKMNEFLTLVIGFAAKHSG